MPTSGSYFNPDECPYQPRMTRAAALALRAAGGLKENCVVVVTDGPVIGVTGFTSPTEIELNPTSPTELGLTARVHTTFDNSAWTGMYDIDLGTAGSIIKLTDNFNNTVEDTDADSPTVHTQWPWHIVTGLVRDNYVNDCTLTGWPSSGTFTVQDNVFDGATINLTGKTGNFNVIHSEFRQATITLSGGADTLSRSYFGVTTITHSGTGAFTFNDSRVENFFRISHTGATGLVCTASQFSGQGTGTSDLQHSATVGATSIVDSEVHAANNGLALPNIINDGTVGAGNTVSLTRTKLMAQGHLIRKQAGSTNTLGIQSSIFRGGVAIVDMTPTSTGQITVIGSDIQGGSVISNGGSVILGQNPVTNFQAGSVLYGATIQTLVGSTRTLQITGTIIQGGCIVQLSQVGGGAGIAFIENSKISGSPGVVVVDIQAVGVTTGTWFVLKNSEVVNGGRVVTNSTDINNNYIENTVVDNNALLTMSAGASNIKHSRISGATITTGAFSHTNLIVDGAFTKTLTAANVNRLLNKSFSDVI